MIKNSSYNLHIEKYYKGKQSIEERAIQLAHYIVETKDTIRGTAKKFGISKSTVHTEVTLKNGKRNCRGRRFRRPDSRKY